MSMAKFCSALLIALLFFFFFTLSLASHAPADNDEAPADNNEASSHTRVAVLHPNLPVNSEKQFNTFTLTKIPFNRRFLARPKLPSGEISGSNEPAVMYSCGDNVIYPLGVSNSKEPVVHGGTYGNDMVDSKEPVVHSGGAYAGYGNDMIYPSGVSDSKEPVVHGGTYGNDMVDSKEPAVHGYGNDMIYTYIRRRPSDPLAEFLKKLKKYLGLENGDHEAIKGGFMRGPRKFIL